MLEESGSLVLKFYKIILGHQDPYKCSIMLNALSYEKRSKLKLTVFTVNEGVLMWPYLFALDGGNAQSPFLCLEQVPILHPGSSCGSGKQMSSDVPNVPSLKAGSSSANGHLSSPHSLGPAIQTLNINKTRLSNNIWWTHV